MTQVMVKQQPVSGFGSGSGSALQRLPLEVVHLLKVFARIEARRQEKMRAGRQEVA